MKFGIDKAKKCKFVKSRDLLTKKSGFIGFIDICGTKLIKMSFCGEGGSSWSVRHCLRHLNLSSVDSLQPLHLL